MSRAMATTALTAGVLFAASAHAIDFTYLEAGPVWENFDETSSSTSGGGAVNLDAASGFGVRFAGGVGLPLGWFIDGEAQVTAPELEARAGADRNTINGDSITVRGSLGYKFQVFDLAAVFAQVGYVDRQFDPDGSEGLDLFNLNEEVVDTGEIEANASGYEVTFGARAEVTPRIELTGALNFSDIGALSLPTAEQFGDLAFEDGVAFEGGVIWDLWGPTALRATYEIGETDTAFIGLRAQF